MIKFDWLLAHSNTLSFPFDGDADCLGQFNVTIALLEIINSRKQLIDAIEYTDCNLDDLMSNAYNSFDSVHELKDYRRKIIVITHCEYDEIYDGTLYPDTKQGRQKIIDDLRREGFFKEIKEV